MSSPSSKTEGHFKLSARTRLSPNVHLFKPNQDATKNANGVPKAGESPPPKLVALMTWMGAHPAHISKYAEAYRSRYPTAQILIVQSSTADFFYRRSSTIRQNIKPAVSAILSACPPPTTTNENHKSANSKDKQRPEILMHIFSNGGSLSTIYLMQLYTQTTNSPFPAHIKILDSCPGRSTFKRAVLATSASLPKFSFPPLNYLLLFVFYILMGAYFLTYTIILVVTGQPDPIERIRCGLNDPYPANASLGDKTSISSEVSRCYIYSENDPMVWYVDVEDHAKEAKTIKGLCDGNVRKEKFTESGHVAHARVGGGGRYWGIVDREWRDSQK